jgi:S1-C subfamily serine protease
MGFDDFLREVLGGMGQVAERDPEQPEPLPESSSAPEPAEAGGIGGVMRAVVQVVGLRQGFFGGMSSVWTGSGTIVDPAGIILTNCHVASPREMACPRLRPIGWPSP